MAEPVKAITDQIADRLRCELLAGKYEVGQPLREARMAEQFGVSRGPIRKVFEKLTREGLLVARTNLGVFVAHQPTEEIRELLRPLRVKIETYALERPEEFSDVLRAGVVSSPPPSPNHSTSAAEQPPIGSNVVWSVQPLPSPPHCSWLP